MTPRAPEPEPVDIGSLDAQEAFVVRRRGEHANREERLAADHADTAAHLRQSVSDFLAIAYAKRGLRRVVGITGDGRIMGFPNDPLGAPAET